MVGANFDYGRAALPANAKTNSCYFYLSGTHM
jgi:hypothetical protein